MRGPWWRYSGDDEEKTRRCFVIAWGNVVVSPKEEFKDLRSVKFAIKTGRGADRNERHLVCVAYGKGIVPVIARAAERGDMILACGTWVEKLKSRTKKGIHPTYECHVKFVIPLGLIGFLYDLYCLPDLHRKIEERNNDAPDGWESD